MRATAVSKLKATLSESLSLVKGGEEILVTERGKPVAKLVPVTGLSADSARRMDLARRGVIRTGTGFISESVMRDLPSAGVPEETILRVIEEDREETR